jgi:hypothetical protein
MEDSSLQHACPMPTKDDKVFMDSFKTTEGFSLEQLIKKNPDKMAGGNDPNEASSNEASSNEASNTCIYTLAIVMTLTVAGASTVVIMWTLKQSGISLETITSAKKNLEDTANQFCSTFETSAATHFAKKNDLIPFDCKDYHEQIAKLAEKLKTMGETHAGRLNDIYRYAFGGWAGALAAATKICEFCKKKEGGRRSTKKRRYRKSKKSGKKSTRRSKKYSKKNKK